MQMKHFARVCLVSPLLTGLASPGWSEESGDTREKVIFHLDETRNARWALMPARSYLDDSPKAKIVIVAYGSGIDFLLEDAQDKNGNPYDHRVRTLVDRGAEFRVCATTLSARDVAKEDLLEAASIVPSGIPEIALLQVKEGYAYLKP